MKKISIKSSRDVFINGILHQNGNGILFIVVHGFKDNMNIYAVKQLSIVISKYYSVFRFTFPDVEKNSNDFNMIDEIHYLHDVIGYFKGKYKKIILVGGSLGGLVCSLTAMENEDIDGLITLNGLSYFWGLHRRFNKYLILIALTFPFNGIYARIYKYYKKFFKPEKIFVRTLVVTSESDKMISYKQSLKFFSSLTTNKKIKILKDADHGLTKIEYINEVTNTIINWLKENK